MNPMDLSARALAEAVQRGQTTPRAVAEAALARVAERNPLLNALCLVNPALIEDADTITARLAAGEELPLAGVPVVIKDNIWVKGLRITQGSRLFADFIAPEDARAVASLRRAGAMILGIGTCSEFACKGLTNTPLHGITRNPTDPSLTPGGSSGGPAAAVAGGLAPLALGTDAGGSSRRPPAHVGVVGFKPGQDVVPYGPGFAEPFDGISALCPITRDVDDAGLMFRVLGGAAPRDHGPLRIACAPSFGMDAALDNSVADNFAQIVRLLRDSGHLISETAPLWPHGITPAATMPAQWAGLADLYGARWQREPDLFDPDLGTQIEQGLAQTDAQVQQARDAGRLMGQTLRTFLTTCDILITPTTPCPAWPVGLLGPTMIGGHPASPRDHAAFTPQVNHAGVPAISILCGTTDDGLPLGLQLIASKGHDNALLGAALSLEKLFLAAGLTARMRKD
ncbi:amidase [Pseudoruegeria sp. SK021]|uniref:amidase n=1 Tax=Pseudoruegeria sp. SK021 TaxID=1933035 RepID=UPI000A24F967|nr:amidase [Pseudoruegeria sp. SK021]OSP54575.1 hypothetical protein BV911_11990 [Pseudoruegeria sp. SK021]